MRGPGPLDPALASDPCCSHTTGDELEASRRFPCAQVVKYSGRLSRTNDLGFVFGRGSVRRASRQERRAVWVSGSCVASFVSPGASCTSLFLQATVGPLNLFWTRNA